MTYPSVNYEVQTPINFLERSVLVYPEKTAVIYNDRRYSYQEFYDRVNRLASALKKAGIGKGDKVAFFCPNTPPMLEAHYAVPLIGAALVSINIRLSAGEVGYILDHSDSKMVFVDNEFAGVVEPSMDDLKKVEAYVNICDESPDRPLTGMEYEEFLQTGEPSPVESEIDDERDVITINYTSGTTGRPKGVMYHHRGAYLTALDDALETLMSYDSVYLWTLPMFHCNGWCFTWGVTAVGATHVCLRKVDPVEIFRLIQKENVSHMCGAPIVLIGMANYAQSEKVKLERPLKIATGGAPPSPAIIEQMEAIGGRITHVYGLTEVYGPNTICAWHIEWDQLPPEEQAELRARQGVPYIVSKNMDVVDQQTMQPVPRDGKTIGEIVMRGNLVMLGYYKDPEATEAAFSGGWFHSGDLAVMHPNNYVQIMDREKDIIISGGENISSVEVENTLYKHPAVLEVAVVASPDPKWGEVPKAFITVKEGTNPSEADLIEFCKENLARYKAPKKIEFTELPKTATGKIQKYVLRRQEKENIE